MLRKPRIGLLPLYLELYDQTLPDMRRELEPFLQNAIGAFEKQRIEVVPSSICRVRTEFEEAVALFDTKDVDIIVTLHLAYSPSLESAKVLAEAGQPILMLDTTPDESFGRDVDPNRLLYNHGIHGLQDLASVLNRFGKRYQVVAGHLSDPALMRRASGVCRAAMAAKQLSRTRALRIGPVFEGMGDFQAEPSALRTLGFEVDEISPDALLEDVDRVTEDEIEAELVLDEDSFRVEVDSEVHRRTTRLCLGLRRYLEKGGYDAFSMNFLAFDYEAGPLSTVPFLECSKAMSRGIGYAGEGDVLTAPLVGVLQRAFGGATFTEIFCPDWKGGSLFLSHMGEINPEVAAEKPRLYEKQFPFTRAQNPAAIACAPKPGPGTLVNLAPGPGQSFQLVLSRVEILGDGSGPGIDDWIRAWVRPEMKLEEFLEAYSEVGGTHHSALMIGDRVEELLSFALWTGLDFVLLEP